MKQGLTLGQLDRRIQIERTVVAYSDSGAGEDTWSVLYTIWAKVEFPQTGQDEVFLGDQHVAVTRANFTIRHRDGLGEKDRVKYNEQVYDILNIIETAGERKGFLILQCEKRI